MSVGKIALGVFFGNLAFALVAWAALTIVFDNAQSKISAAQAHARLMALTDQQNAADVAERAKRQ